jgi:hypothetical protein
MNPFIDMIRFTPNEKRYYHLSARPMALFTVLFIAAAVVIKTYRTDLPYALLVAIAITPAIPMGWFFKVYIDYFRDCDEWEKLIEIYGICIAVLIVGMAYFTLGLLGVMELVTLDGAWLAYGMLPAVSLTYVVGKIIGRWRHG